MPNHIASLDDMNQGLPKQPRNRRNMPVRQKIATLAEHDISKEGMADTGAVGCFQKWVLPLVAACAGSRS